MKKTLVLSCLLLSTFSYASTILNVKLVPYFKYEQSLYSCEHLEQVFEFSLMGNVENGKLTSATFRSEGFYKSSIQLSGAELSDSAVELDPVSENPWLSKLALNAQSLYWLFDHLENSPTSRHCPLEPFQSVAIDPANPQFEFTGYRPGIGFGSRYAPAITFHGTLQTGGEFSTYQATLGFRQSQAW